jgi:hypothetical protein
MNSVMVNMLNIGVTFDPTGESFSFTGDITDKTISIEQGISMVAFTLSTTEGSEFEASFQSSPFQWFESDGRTPMLPPSSYLVQWFRPKYCAITCFNVDAFQNEFTFNIVVVYNGKTHGTDPVIVNLPPGASGPPSPPPAPHK